jgi:probable F420-dependent oxidoreductase
MNDSPAAVRCSVGLPQMLGPDGADVLVRFARRAEELGFARLWTMDGVVGGATSHAPLIDGLHALTYAAALTDTIPLGIAVIVLPRRNPALLAKELASIDRLSGGRLTVGVGLGAGGDDTAAGLGFATDRRVRRLTEAVEVMRALWTAEEAAVDGEVFRFSGVRMGVEPVQRPYPPVWVGAGKQAALRRAVRIGDGWIGAGSSSSEDFLAQAPLVAEALREAGRDPAAFPVAKRVYLAVEDTPERARERLTPVLDGLYGHAGLTERVGVCGTVEQCAEELRRLSAAGADELLLHPLYDPLDQLEALAAVARRVA